MKKLILILLFLWGTTCMLFAQEHVKTDVANYLRNEGYAPTFDDDGDIVFKIQGTTYYVIISDTGSYMSAFAPFQTDTPIGELLKLANKINREKYVFKCSAYESGEHNVFDFGMEFMIDTQANTELLVGKMLQLLPACVEEFEDELE